MHKLITESIAAAATIVGIALTPSQEAATDCSNATPTTMATAVVDNESANDRLARQFVEREIDAHWSETDNGMTTRFQRKNALGDVIDGDPNLLYRQIRKLSFTLDAIAKPDGDVQYAARINFGVTATREYRLEQSDNGPQGWSAWRDSAVGSFAVIEKRNGKWAISNTDLFEGVKANASKVPKG